jgi:hypothetical protein
LALAETRWPFLRQRKLKTQPAAENNEAHHLNIIAKMLGRFL